MCSSRMQLPNDTLAVVVCYLDAASIGALSLCDRRLRAWLLTSVKTLKDPLALLVALLSPERLWLRSHAQRRFALTRREMEALPTHRLRYNAYACDKFDVMRLVLQVHGTVSRSRARAAENATQLQKRREARDRLKRRRYDEVAELVCPHELHSIKHRAVFTAFVKGKMPFWSAQDLVAHVALL